MSTLRDSASVQAKGRLSDGYRRRRPQDDALGRSSKRTRLSALPVAMTCEEGGYLKTALALAILLGKHRRSSNQDPGPPGIQGIHAAFDASASQKENANETSVIQEESGQTMSPPVVSRHGGQEGRKEVLLRQALIRALEVPRSSHADEMEQEAAIVRSLVEASIALVVTSESEEQEMVAILQEIFVSSCILQQRGLHDQDALFPTAVDVYRKTLVCAKGGESFAFESLLKSHLEACFEIIHTLLGIPKLPGVTMSLSASSASSSQCSKKRATSLEGFLAKYFASVDEMGMDEATNIFLHLLCEWVSFLALQSPALASQYFDTLLWNQDSSSSSSPYLSREDQSAMLGFLRELNERVNASAATIDGHE